MDLPFHIISSIIFFFLLLSSTLSQVISSANLTQPLLAGRAGTNVSSITGESIQLRPFNLFALANETHIQISFNISQGYNEVGWVALGLGTSMSDSAMVILWPNENSRSWMISHRTAGGHTKPVFDPSTASSAIGRWTLVPELTTFDSQGGYTLVTITRTLALPKNQVIYPPSQSKYVNLSRNRGQKFIFASSSRRPSTDQEGSMMMMHDGGMYGTLEIDLSKKWTDLRTAGSAPASEEEDIESTGWTKFDKIIAAHAAFAMLTWLLVAPSAVLIARIGRRWGRWFQWHSRIQLFATLPLTVCIISLGFAGALSVGSASRLDLHKTLGLVLGLLLLFQLSLGQLSHLSHFTPSRSSTRPFTRVFHILVGVSTLVLGWATIFLGIEEWEEHSTKAWESLEIVYAVGITMFLLPYLLSLLFLGIQRFREGRSLYHALFGLGQTSASPSTTVARDWMKGLPSSVDRSARNSYIERGAGVEGAKRRGSSACSVEIPVEEKEKQ